MPNPTYLAIYQRAQNVANLLAEQNGWKTTPDAFCSTSDNPRILTLFSNACDILAELEGHEMQDIIDEVEAVKPNSTFADMVAKSKERQLAEAQKKEQTQADIIAKGAAALRPLIETLNQVLPDYDMKAKLHTDPRHLPCPAIHIEGKYRAHIYDRFGEICIRNTSVKTYFAGGCNSHSHQFTSEEGLLQHIADSLGSLAVK
ncbi:MAG: hypothetical protein GY774_35275 [Planctomycetes bacterium]|nr:hypothetical protein [Planctomycetota bacterium]